MKNINYPGLGFAKLCKANLILALLSVCCNFVYAQDGCSPLSTLPCASLQVTLPYNLSFNASVSNTITDKNGQGTGFTTVNNYSGTRLAVDGQPSNNLVPGYEPSKITLTGGRLQLVTNKGIDFLTNNNQLNILGVKIATDKKLQIDVKVINPANGTLSQQAGIWYGLDDKTYIKLTISGNKVELRKELNDVSSSISGNTNPDQRITAAISGLNTQTVSLRLVIDPSTNTVDGLYSTDGVNFTNAGVGYTSTGISIAGMGLTNSTAYAAIYATHRNATTAVTYNFDDFSIIGTDIPVSQSVNIDFLPAGSTVPAGYTGDTGLPFDATRKYGWIDPVTKQPADLQANMRIRSGTGDEKLRSLVVMQASTNGQRPGTWEYAVPNGQYRVTVSAGDDGYYDSDHQINVEGLPTISDFIPSSQLKYKSAIATVQVSDGKLTIDATGGSNTKMNYLTFAPATSVTDVTLPTASARLSGTLKSAGVYDGQVQVIITANDLGGSGLASLQYSINNGSYINYKAPFSITTAGNYSLKVKAVDANNNQRITSDYTFSVAPQTTKGVLMVLKNPDAFPSDDRLIFSLIQTPWRRTDPITPYNANHDKIKLQINNKGTARLNINKLTLSKPAAWKIVTASGDSTGTAPIGINPGASTEVTIQFRARDAASTRSFFTDTLTIASNDSISPVKKVVLVGLWQKEGESIYEPYGVQIIAAFGFTSTTGFGHDDGNINGTTRVPSSSEVVANYFVKADPSKPVTVHQMAAYHGCCAAVESFQYYRKGSPTPTTVFTHNSLDGQSLMPRLANTASSPAMGTFNPTGVFGIKVGSSYSDRTKNAGGLIGIRVIKVMNADGNIVPNAYILDCDYVGIPATNFDYQDNVYYVDNIKPDSGSVHYADLAATPTSAINFNPTLTGASASVTISVKNMGIAYPDGTNDSPIQLKGVSITGPNAGEFSVTALKTSTLAVQAMTPLTVKFTPSSVGIKNAALLVNYNSASAPLRIPLYGIGNNSTSIVNVIKRIKAGADVNITIGNNLYESDKNYRKGSVKLDAQVVKTNVAGTDIDSLYVTYLSAAVALGETRLEIPVTNGNYLVRMHFVENYWTAPASRIFTTFIENQEVLTNFDIFKEVGYRAALVKDFSTTVNDGVLTIKFNPTADRVGIAGLELFQISNTSELTSTLSINKLADSKKKITVYPNPNTGNSFYLNASNFGKRENVVLSISNMFGKLIRTEKFMTDDMGAASLYISLFNKLDRGVYIINTSSFSGNLVSKLLVE
jgi:hypothetical protein